MIGKIIRRISEWEGAGEADLLSYILFDGEFSARLIELGRSDAKARHAELCAFFDELAPRTPRTARRLATPSLGIDQLSPSRKATACHRHRAICQCALTEPALG